MNRPVYRSAAPYLGSAALAATAALATAYAPLCGAQEDSRPLYQVEVIAFAYNDANPDEEAFPRQTPREAASDLLYQAAPLEEFDFDAALSIGATLDGTARGADQGAAIGASGLGTAEGGAETAAGGNGASAGDRTAAGPSAGDATVSGASANDGTAPGASAGDGTGDRAAGADGGALSNASRPANPEPLIGPRGFRLLGSESYKLGAAYAKLERLDAYRPLLHAAWIQPALSADQAKTISTADLGALNPEGSLEFYASRYLHFTVDLRYRPTNEERAQLSGGAPVGSDPVAIGPGVGTGAAANASGQISSSAGGYYGSALDEISLGPSLTMKASRRIAAGEVQYFDHPYFGLIVLVTPYDPQTQQPDGVAPVP